MNVFSDSVYGALSPREAISTWDWLCEHGALPDGGPWDPDLYPHLKRVCDAWDDPRYRLVALQFATRCGKTAAGHGCLEASTIHYGGDAVLAAPNRDLVHRQIGERIWPSLEAIDRRLGGTLDLPPESQQGADRVDLPESSIVGVWSGSPAALGDLDARWLMATEADKFSKHNTGEADSLDLVLERAKNNPDARLIVESTPTITNFSRIERLYKQSTAERRWVPCPHCNEHQVLATKQLRWDHLPDGSSEPDFAYQTARYVCAHCQAEIHNHHRGAMLRRGVWAPAGCHVDRRGRIAGTPLRPYALSCGLQLSSHYSLMLSWGDLAKKFCELCRSRDGLEHWQNSWEGVTWSPLRKVSSAEIVLERLRDSQLRRGQVPDWCQLLTFTSDVQVDRWPWMVVAHGEGERRAIVDWGTTWSWEALWQQAAAFTAGRNAIVLCDSGERTLETYRWCSAHDQPYVRRVLPCKGDPRKASGRFRVEVLGVTTRARRQASKLSRGQVLVHCPVSVWESEIHALLEDREPGGQPPALALPAEADLELVADVTNATVDEQGVWVKRDKNNPNDWRDCLKYALCAAALEVEQFRRGLWPASSDKPSEAGPAPARKPQSSASPRRRLPRRQLPRRR